MPLAAAPLDIAPPEMVEPAKSPLDGLTIFLSWKGRAPAQGARAPSHAPTPNDDAVKDIEIACKFARRNGSHLTDRRRIIPDTVNMKSRKRYAGMLVGLNVNAEGEMFSSDGQPHLTLAQTRIPHPKCDRPLEPCRRGRN